MNKLPENVIELEYLVINNFIGKNYVDTGIVGNQNTCISVKFRTGNDINVIGARRDRNQGNYGINIGVHNSTMLLDYSSSRINSSVNPLNNIVEVSQHINTFSLYNGAASADFNTAASTFTTSVPLTIGAINTPVEPVTGVNKALTIYYCKIYSDPKTIVRNFIPVIYDGVVCFWDLVTSMPFYNAGPDKLLAGPVKTYHNKIQLTKPNEVSNLKFVDCIVSDGRQYIDTGYIPNYRTGIKTEFMFNDFGAGFTWTLFGSRGTNYTDRSFELYSWKNKWNLNYHTSNNTTKVIDYKYKDKWLKVYANENIWQIDDLTFNLTAVTFTGAKSLYLCATNEGVVSAYGAIKIRRTLIYNNDVLVRDFRPCIYNGEVGMWDEISGTFYSNQGTGEFGYEDFVESLYLPNPLYQIPEGYKVASIVIRPESQPDGLEYLEYIENPGLQYIDTGFYDTNGVSVDIDLKINKINLSNVWVFGNRFDNIWLGTNTSNHLKLYNNSYSGSQVIQGYSNTFQKYNIKAKFGLDECWCEVDGNKVNFNPCRSINPDVLTLFIANTNFNDATNWRIYKTIIYDSNGTMVRDFRPCIYNGEVGMWDEVHGTFYGNQGTGEFIGGPSLQRIILDGSSISTAEASSISLLSLDDEDLLFNTDYSDEELEYEEINELSEE